jgi:hypothetical protein
MRVGATVITVGENPKFEIATNFKFKWSKQAVTLPELSRDLVLKFSLVFGI